MALKLITIDFWNTLFDSSNGNQRNELRQDSLLNEIRKYNLRITENEFNQALKESWEYFNNIWMNEQRTPKPDDTVTYFWNYLKLPYDQDSIEILTKVFSESILIYPPKLMDGAKETIEILSNHFKLSIISDTGFTPGTILKELMRRNGILDYFSAFSFSDETDVAKPHPKAYQTILNHFNILPEEALHIGDIEKTDIKGAKDIGMRAIKFSGDPTSRFSNEKIASTKADIILYSWKEIQEYLLKN